VRSRISSRSNSAIAASRVKSSRPVGVVVSNSGSPSDLKKAPDQLEQLARRPTKAIELGDQNDVARRHTFISLVSSGRSARAAKPRAVDDGAGKLTLRRHLFADATEVLYVTPRHQKAAID
jgi:hypothetical protein